MLGAKADFNGLRIEPCLPSGWEECSVDRHYRDAVYRIVIRNPERIQSGKAEITVDGNRLEGNLIPAFSDGCVHEVEVIIRK
ncbi:N,N'-diacetylchitobiose phosphorylase [compost metagenome]